MRDWHKAQVKAAVEMSGQTLTDIARAHGLHSSAVRHALRNRPNQPGLRIKAIVAAAIGRTPHEIWPSLFDGDNQPRSTRGKYTTRRRRAHVSGRIQRQAA